MNAHVQKSMPAQLKGLPEDVRTEIDRKLHKGDGPYKIARWLHDEMGLLKNISIETLKKYVDRYRSGPFRQDQVQSVTEAVGYTKTAKLWGRFNALEEMQDLVQVQHGRLKKVLDQEKGLPKGILLKQASAEIRQLHVMLNDLGRLQMETGILPRAPKTITGTVTDADGEVREFAWTEEQQQLFDQLKTISGEVLDLEPQPAPEVDYEAAEDEE